MTTSARQQFATGFSVAASLALAFLAAPAPARAGDFPHDVEHTFTTDIPHFFQDDIPCAFGGQPTSGTRSSCKGPSHPAAAHKATTHKKKRSTTKHPAAKPATGTPPSDPASAGASAGAAADAPPAAIPGYR